MGSRELDLCYQGDQGENPSAVLQGGVYAKIGIKGGVCQVVGARLLALYKSSYFQFCISFCLSKPSR